MVGIGGQLQGGDVGRDEISAGWRVVGDIDAQVSGDPEELLVDIIFGAIGSELQDRHFVEIILHLEPSTSIRRRSSDAFVVHVGEGLRSEGRHGRGGTR